MKTMIKHIESERLERVCLLTGEKLLEKLIDKLKI
jgi:hypothetical protein